MESKYSQYIPSIGLLGLALIPIVTGSFNSLKIPKEFKIKFKSTTEEGDADDEEEEEESETITSSDAIWFPVLGSITLGGLYSAFKYLNKDLINLYLGYYFNLMGIGSLSRGISTMIKSTLSKQTYNNLTKWNLSLTKNSNPYSHFSFNTVHIISFIASILLTLINIYFPTNKYNWILQNIFGLFFAFNAICLVKLNSFSTGFILLGGLFFYDIYWVFYSAGLFNESVMVAVAKNFEAPIKLVFPKDFSGTAKGMLGLGDIVVPGIFVALALRFDYYLALKRTTTTAAPTKFPKPYFISCFIAYIVALTTCIVIMHSFKAAQPALLYLSPLCSLSVLICAAIKGELGELLGYEEEPSEEKDEELINEKKEEPEEEEVVEEKVNTTAIEENEGNGKRVLRSRKSLGGK